MQGNLGQMYRRYDRTYQRVSRRDPAGDHRRIQERIRSLTCVRDECYCPLIAMPCRHIRRSYAVCLLDVARSALFDAQRH